MNGQRRFQFSVWNLMLAVTVAAVFSVCLSWTAREQHGLSAIAPLIVGAPAVAGTLIGGIRGLMWGTIVGVASVLLVFGVVLLLMMLDVVRIEI